MKVIIHLMLVLLLLAACSESEQTKKAGSAAQAMVSEGIKPAEDKPEENKPSDAASLLVFEPDHVDMGSVKEGEEAVAMLRVRNSGSTMQQIVDIQTSCGCSVAEPEQKLVMPGDFTHIKVVIDTFAKQDDVKKWVTLTDAEGKTSKAWLSLVVRPNPHMGDVSRSIFDGKCAACHYDTAKGTISGPDIYAAVCGMCHGAKAEGAAAPGLKHHRDADILTALIRDGTGSQHMPGFALNKGGPLTDKQISALSQWLSTLDE